MNKTIEKLIQNNIISKRGFLNKIFLKGNQTQNNRINITNNNINNSKDNNIDNNYDINRKKKTLIKKFIIFKILKYFS